MKIALACFLFFAYQQPLPDGRVSKLSHQLHDALQTIETLQKEIRDLHMEAERTALETDKRISALEGWRFSASPLLDIVPASGAQISRINARLNTVEQRLRISAP